MTAPDVFLSYCREDQATARRFAEGLEAPWPKTSVVSRRVCGDATYVTAVCAVWDEAAPA
jgi:hypothetical protein